MPTSLVDRLRAADDETLAALLRLRPDLAVPPPADLTVLATRAGIRASVHRACEDLDTVALAVLEALVVADADQEPVSLAELRRLLGPGRAGRRRRPRPGGAARAGAGLGRRRRVGAGAGGAGRGAALSGWAGPPGHRAGRVVGAAASCWPPSTRTNGGCSTRWPPARRSGAAGPGPDPQSPVGRLLARGLLLRVDADTVELPRQVALALRGDRPLGAVSWRRREVGARDRGADVVDRTAGGAALEALRQVELLVGFWSRPPPPVLRSGGLGVRELRRAAKEMDADESAAALLVELAVAADLVAETDGVDAGVGADHAPSTSGPRAVRSCAGRRWPAPGWSCRGCPGWSGTRTTPGGRSRRCPTGSGGRWPRGTGAGCWPGWPSSPRVSRPGRRPGWPSCWPGAPRGAAAGCATRSSAGCWPRPPCSASSRWTRCPPRGGCCSTIRTG